MLLLASSFYFSGTVKARTNPRENGGISDKVLCIF